MQQHFLLVDMEYRSTPPTLRSRLLCGVAWGAATTARWALVFAATGLAGAASQSSYWRRVTTIGAVLGLGALVYGFALGPERSRRQLYQGNRLTWRDALAVFVIVLLGRYLVRLTG